jgi:hypothetical protein
MKVVIHTQHYENYGAHDWDGEGECPQYWKAKGGLAFQVTGVSSDCDVDTVVEYVHDKVSFRNEGFESQIVGVTLEADDWMSWFEKSQLEYDGSITYPEPSISLAQAKQEFLAKFDQEYSEWAATA